MAMFRKRRNVTQKRRPFKKIFKNDLSGFGGLSTRLPSPELKTVDTTVSHVISTTFVATALNLLAVGADQFNRVGKRTVGKYLKLRLSITSGGAVALNVLDHMRTLVVYDRQVNGAGASYGQIMQSFNAAGGATGTSYSAQNPDNQERFVILYDSSQVLPSGAVATTNPVMGNSPLMIVKHISLKNLNTIYAANTALIGSVTTGSLYIYSISQNNVLANAAYTLNGECRYAFTDA